MPTPKPYTAADGAETWRVRYRDTHGRSCSRTFHRRTDAQWFATTIETHGVRAALRALDDMEAETRPTDSPDLDTIWREFIEWKADYVRTKRTVRDYERQYADSIRPTFGTLPIDTIRPEDVATWVDRMVAGKIVSVRTGKRLSVKSISGRHALLYAIMKFAAAPQRAYILANPCSGAELPKQITPTPKGLMPAEWQALHAALVQIDPDAADLASFLLGTGWRWGEAAALTPIGVEDYGSHGLWITMMQVRRRDEEGVYGIAADDGKAQKSMRRIKVDAHDANILRRRMVGLGPNDPVFTGVDRSTGERAAWTYNMFRRRFRDAIAVANISRKPTVHWLRHTHVAWLAMSGTPLPELQARIGHASIQTTIGVYGSMIGDIGDDRLTAFSEMRSGAPLAIGP